MSLTRRSLIGRAGLIAGAQLLTAKGVAEASAPVPRPRFATNPFALGVASGDPRTDGATIWTRLVGAGLEPLEPPTRVRWEVSERETFSCLVGAGDSAAVQPAAHALHIDVIGLQPGRDYFYRFCSGDAVSGTGRFRTLPITADRFRVALSSCQHWEHGYFSAYTDLVRQAPDLVLQVGDYIYEKSFGKGPDVRQFPSPDPVTLPEYRARHALYKSDPQLQAAHAAAAWMVAPDDHEVENDFAGTYSALSDSDSFMRRRAGAFQAYLEHMPLSLTRLTPGGLRFHGKCEIGDLAMLYLLDTRQYRSPQPGAPDGRAGGTVIRKDEASRPAGRSMLGAVQEAWLLEELGRPQPAWTILAQQTLFAPLVLQRPEGEMIWSDMWEGYPAAREALLTALDNETVQRAVVLSGDVHSFWRNDILHEGRHIADEVVTSCLASRNAPAALFATAEVDNPHVKYLNNTHSGYALAEFSRGSARVSFRAVRSLTDPDTDVFELYAAEIEGRAAVSKQDFKGGNTFRE